MVGVHIRDSVLTEDGRVDVKKIQPIARLGYLDYTTVVSTFSLPPVGEDSERRIKTMAGERLGICKRS